MQRASVLSNIPTALREPLFACYSDMVSNYMEHRWEPSELNGGKFCEVVYTILNGYLVGSYPSKPSKPKNMLEACQAMEKTPANTGLVGDRSARILIPRLLPFLYEIRNNRGVGHIGGDVNPNFLDATGVINMCSWIMAELIRIFHNISIKEAQELVDVLVERKHPLVWEFENIRRVLSPQMKISNQALVLLHTKPGWVGENDLFKWLEYSTISLFKKRILEPLHKSRLIEFDKANGRARISPLGVTEVEAKILAPEMNHI